MRKGRWSLVMLRDFSRGLVSQTAPHMLKEGEWADLVNVRLDEDGSVKKRGGSTVKNSTVFLRYD